ncbi:MAG: MerR family transcriptional regulator [Halioglobus sp.]|nr:MerR family transcriptional regulator [Halioglobus sp.]
MPRHKVKAHSGDSRQYRMSELVQTSGVSRDMIKYYLRAGLLPQPSKPRPNLSLYTDNHLLLIRLILRVQQQTSLSLPEIATAFRAANYDPTTIEIELLSDKYHAGRRDFIIPFEAETRSDVSLSVPQAFLDNLHRHGLLDQTDHLDESQREIAGLLWAASNEGVPIDFFQAAREKLQALAELEVKALIAIQRPQLHFGEVVSAVTGTDRVVNRWMISEKTRMARHLFQRVIENSEKALSTVHDTIYLPSKLFRKRFRIDEELAGIAQAISKNPRNRKALHNACRTCLLLADYEGAQGFADAALALKRNDDFAIACKCLAYAMDKDLEQAQRYADMLATAQSTHTIAMEARLLTLLMQAAKLGGVSDTTELMKQAADLFREPLSVSAEEAFDHFEASLLRARANTIFPDAINALPEAISDLQSMQEKLEGNSYQALGLPAEGTRLVYQVYTSFYLGQLHEATGAAAQARRYYEKVIQLDPSSNFGEMAYLKLG